MLSKKRKREEKKSIFREQKGEMYTQLNPYLSSRWILYILISQDGSRTYCGITTDFVHRFRQHLGLIKGGARYTKIKKGVTKEGELAWNPVCLVSGWDGSGEMTRKCEYRMHHSMRYTAFRQWKNQVVFAHKELWHILKKNAGIQYRLLCLLYFLSEYFKENNLLQITWFQKEYRQEQLWKNTSVKELFAEPTVFAGILKEYQHKQTKV